MQLTAPHTSMHTDVHPPKRTDGLPLRTFQDAFSAALFDHPVPVAHTDDGPMAALQAQPGFAVYRNTVLKGCIDALQANYPTVNQLVGDGWFRAAAGVYARAHPPHCGLLMDYGEAFAAFLAQFEPADALPYLPAIARLDRCWTECHLASDATALGTDWLAQQHPAALPTRVLRPHPAARWAWCEEHPAYTLWQAHRSAASAPEDLPWQGDGGLLTRPHDAVTWHPLPRAGVAFLDACSAGMALEEAATVAITAEPAIDFAALMALLLRAGALTQAITDTSLSSQHDQSTNLLLKAPQ